MGVKKRGDLDEVFPLLLKLYTHEVLRCCHTVAPLPPHACTLAAHSHGTPRPARCVLVWWLRCHANRTSLHSCMTSMIGRPTPSGSMFRNCATFWCTARRSAPSRSMCSFWTSARSASLCHCHVVGAARPGRAVAPTVRLTLEGAAPSLPPPPPPRRTRSLQFAHQVWWFLTAFCPDAKCMSTVAAAVARGKLQEASLRTAIETQGGVAGEGTTARGACMDERRMLTAAHASHCPQHASGTSLPACAWPPTTSTCAASP